MTTVQPGASPMGPETIPPGTPTIGRRGPSRLAVAVIIVALLVIPIIMACISTFLPSRQKAEIPQAERPALVTGGKIWDRTAIVQDGRLFVPVEVLASITDGAIAWDPNSQTVTLTTANQVIRMGTHEVTAYVNTRPTVLHLDPLVQEGVPYVAAEPVANLLDLKLNVSWSPPAVVLEPKSLPLQTGEATGHVLVRETPSKRSPFSGEVNPGDHVIVFGEENGWYLVRPDSGMPGWVPKGSVRLQGIRQGESPAAVRPMTWKRTGERVNLVFEHVTARIPDPTSIGSLPGVNVVSPTWFTLSDGEGHVLSKADSRYVQWAHSRNYEAWGLFSNNFDPERTRTFLRDASNRERAIVSLLLYSQMYQLDGINVDFGNMYRDDAPYFVQFIRELTPMAHEQGLSVSVDVTVKSSSPNWSMCYDRKALARFADYIILMAYDEHPSGSQTPGSVASLPWVEQGLRAVLEEVPPSKLLLGVPFYSRLWRQPTAPDGRPTGPVTSRVLSMSDAAGLARRPGVTVAFDPQTGQTLLSFREPGAKFTAWLEDEVSMSARLALVRKYGLRGVASWRRGFEIPSIWGIISRGLSF